MNKGVLIFAHNSRQVDYVLMATVAGALAKKHLDVPVSLVSDKSTLDWLDQTKYSNIAKEVFDKIIVVEKPVTENKRKLRDGTTYNTVPFVNSNRYSAYELSPYDTTLMIDSDYLIFSDNLNNYWNLDYDVMIGKSMNDIVGKRAEILDERISAASSRLRWATTVMFKKSAASQIFFDLVSFVRENYEYYADLYRFDYRQYRNDISFSIARHILNGHIEDNSGLLPEILTVFDSDILEKVSTDRSLKFLIGDRHNPQEYNIASTKNLDVHVINKQSIIRNIDKLLELA
jgi:hypothetical protein